MAPKKKLLILGLGGLAAAIADIAEETGDFDLLGFVINEPPFTRGASLMGKPIFWIDEVADFDKDCLAICPLQSARKIVLIDAVRAFGIQLTSLVHPSAYVSGTVEIGIDVFINSGVQIAQNTRLGNHVVINRGALIGHDVVVGDLCTISPGANIASHVVIGSGARIGMGANIIENIQIGANSIIGAGSLITQDVPDRVKIIGMPARIIERDLEIL